MAVGGGFFCLKQFITWQNALSDELFQFWIICLYLCIGKFVFSSVTVSIDPEINFLLVVSNSSSSITLNVPKSGITGTAESHFSLAYSKLLPEHLHHIILQQEPEIEDLWSASGVSVSKWIDKKI